MRKKDREQGYVRNEDVKFVEVSIPNKNNDIFSTAEENIEYFRTKIYSALNIPGEYLKGSGKYSMGSSDQKAQSFPVDPFTGFNTEQTKQLRQLNIEISICI